MTKEELPVPGVKPKPKIDKAAANAKEREEHRVYLWRLECLEAAGAPKAIAKSLAADVTVDLRKAVKMLDAGRPPEEVAELLPAL